MRIIGEYLAEAHQQCNLKKMHEIGQKQYIEQKKYTFQSKYFCSVFGYFYVADSENDMGFPLRGQNFA